MRDCNIKVKTPLEIRLHHDDDKTAILMGKFSFDMYVDPKDKDQMELIRSVLEMLPNIIDVWYKDE